MENEADSGRPERKVPRSAPAVFDRALHVDHSQHKVSLRADGGRRSASHRFDAPSYEVHVWSQAVCERVAHGRAIPCGDGLAPSAAVFRLHKHGSHRVRAYGADIDPITGIVRPRVLSRRADQQRGGAGRVSNSLLRHDGNSRHAIGHRLTRPCGPCVDMRSFWVV